MCVLLISTSSSTCNGSERILLSNPGALVSQGLHCLFFRWLEHNNEKLTPLLPANGSTHIPDCPIISTRVILSPFLLSLILRTVSTTILCWDCLGVRNIIVFRSDDDSTNSSAAASAAAVFPIPVGALARCAPPLESVSRQAEIISNCPSLGVGCASQDSPSSPRMKR